MRILHKNAIFSIYNVWMVKKGCCVLSTYGDPYIDTTLWNALKQLTTVMPLYVITGDIAITSLPDYIHHIRLPCDDEHKPLVAYYGFRCLQYFQFDYIVKLNDLTTNIVNKVLENYTKFEEELTTRILFSISASNFIVPYSHDSPFYVISRKAYTVFRRSSFENHLFEYEAIKEAMDTSQQQQGQQKRHKCIVGLFNGLGNQLFMIANAIAYCVEHDFDLYIKLRNQNERGYYFDSLLSFYKQYIYTGQYPTIFSEPEACVYNCIPLFNEDICFYGCFTTAKYFPFLRKLLPHMVTFPTDQDTQLHMKYGDLWSSNCVLVHARRGDYIRYAAQFGPLSIEHYAESIKEMKKHIPKPRLILVSDDTDFFTKSPVFQEEETVIVNESDIMTLYIMSKSKAFIMSNSTFSWWGVALSDSHTAIAPKKWFGPNGPPKYEDIYEPTWIRL